MEKLLIANSIPVVCQFYKQAGVFILENTVYPLGEGGGRGGSCCYFGKIWEGKRKTGKCERDMKKGERKRKEGERKRKKGVKR